MSWAILWSYISAISIGGKGADLQGFSLPLCSNSTLPSSAFAGEGTAVPLCPCFCSLHCVSCCRRYLARVAGRIVARSSWYLQIWVQTVRAQHVLFISAKGGHGLNEANAFVVASVHMHNKSAGISWIVSAHIVCGDVC
jgi:hypothetical protein